MNYGKVFVIMGLTIIATTISPYDLFGYIVGGVLVVIGFGIMSSYTSPEMEL